MINMNHYAVPGLWYNIMLAYGYADMPEYSYTGISTYQLTSYSAGSKWINDYQITFNAYIPVSEDKDIMIRPYVKVFRKYIKNSDNLDDSVKSSYLEYRKYNFYDLKYPITYYSYNAIKQPYNYENGDKLVTIYYNNDEQNDESLRKRS